MIIYYKHWRTIVGTPSVRLLFRTAHEELTLLSYVYNIILCSLCADPCGAAKWLSSDYNYIIECRQYAYLYTQTTRRRTVIDVYLFIYLFFSLFCDWRSQDKRAKPPECVPAVRADERTLSPPPLPFPKKHFTRVYKIFNNTCVHAMAPNGIDLSGTKSN